MSEFSGRNKVKSITLAAGEVHDDGDIVAACKPTGLATHAVEAGGDGFVERLQARLGAALGVHQRLDAATSGVLVFSRSERAAASLARQFRERTVVKRYHALTAGRLPLEEGCVEHHLSRLRDGQVRVVDADAPPADRAREAETCYRIVRDLGPWALYEVRPVTGRSHQIRAQLSACGAPILGDLTYGGSPLVGRMLLHAASIEIEHPAGHRVEFRAAGPPLLDPEAVCVEQLLDRLVPVVAGPLGQVTVRRLGTPAETGLPAIKLDRYGDWLAIRHYECPQPTGWRVDTLRELAERLRRALDLRGVYVKNHRLHGRRRSEKPARPALELDPDQPLIGDAAPDAFDVEEAGVRYLASMNDGLGCRLYLDQRDNRVWVRDTVEPGSSMLNLFAYTCSFTVAAAVGGATRTTSVDISTKSLEIGRANLELNGIDPGEHHRFLARDALRTLERAAKRGETWDLVVCDPPSFARRGKATFQVERELDTLVERCLEVVASGGRLLMCVNNRNVRLQTLREATTAAAARLGRTIASLDATVIEDGLGPLGVGTDLKSLQVRLG